MRRIALFGTGLLAALEKKGKLTGKDAHIVLDAPILKVGKGG